MRSRNAACNSCWKRNIGRFRVGVDLAFQSAQIVKTGSQGPAGEPIEARHHEWTLGDVLDAAIQGENLHQASANLPIAIVRSWPGLLVRRRARQQSFCSIAGLPSGSCRQAPRTGSPGRVEMWRGGSRSGLSVAAPFVWRCPNYLAVAPFPHPAHRTGHADFPHPALGQDITPSSTADCCPWRPNVRARSARIGARVDMSRPCVA